MSLSDLEIGTIVVLCVWYILGGIITYEMVLFWKIRESSMLYVRRPLLTMIFCTIVLIRSSLAIPASLSTLTDWKPFRWYSLEWQNFVGDVIGILLANIFLARQAPLSPTRAKENKSTYITPFFRSSPPSHATATPKQKQNKTIRRIWMLFYDFRFSQANLNALWKTHILPETDNDNFWIKHRSNFGNLFWVVKVMIAYSLIFLFILHGIPLIVKHGEDWNLEIHNIFVFILFLPIVVFCIS